MGLLTTRKSYGLKGYLGLSQVYSDEWGFGGCGLQPTSLIVNLAQARLLLIIY